MRYISTNGRSSVDSFREALFQGLAPDGGLFMPERVPRFSPDEMRKFGEMQYWEIAFNVLNKLINDAGNIEIPEKDLMALCRTAYDFDVPLEKIGNTTKKYIMRLDRGPTASFKDFAAGFMAEAMQYFLVNENKKTKILVATSGDTGGAIANAFHGRKNIEVFVLFPIREVTELQRKQMTALQGGAKINVHAIAVDGKFDDCQALVKKAFVDGSLNQELNLSSANSINIGRLLPQSVYYFYAYSRLANKDPEAVEEKIIFSVPSGNFGNLVAGLIAREMGLPVFKFIAAVNENDEFPVFLETGKYSPVVPSKNCLSNAMNVGHPSNLARLVALYGGRMDEKGRMLKLPDMNRLRNDVFSMSVSDEQTLETMKTARSHYKTIIEPHCAVGLFALDFFLDNKLLHGDQESKSLISVCLETAHPAKFPEALDEIGIGEADMNIPQKLQKILEKKDENYLTIRNDYAEFRKLLLKF